VTAGSPESLGKVTIGMIDLPELMIKFPASWGGRWLHYDHLLDERVEFPNYDIALFRNESTLVTAGSPEPLGKLTVGIIDLLELPMKFPGICGGR
jgi:hypothetical protein